MLDRSKIQSFIYGLLVNFQPNTAKRQSADLQSVSRKEFDQPILYRGIDSYIVSQSDERNLFERRAVDKDVMLIVQV